MTTAGGFSDQDLCAFLDGEADDALCAAIREASASDPQLRDRLETLRSASDVFAAAMDAALAAAPPMPELPHVPARRGFGTWSVALAGAVAGAVLVLGLTWDGTPPAKAGWRDVVANYQSLYVTETLAKVDLSPDAQQADLARISEALGFDLTDLPEVAGLSYKRAQQLGFNGKPLAQLTFLAADGGPVALCIIRTNGETTDAIHAEVLSGLDTYSWTDNGYGILLVGPEGQDGLGSAAEAFRAALKNRPV